MDHIPDDLLELQARFDQWRANRKYNVSFRQNGVGTVFFRADAILPKGHKHDGVRGDRLK